MRQKETTVDPRQTERSKLERELQEAFNPEHSNRFTSTAKEAPSSEYVKDLVLPVSSRGRMPLTKENFIGVENPRLVEWEREVRLFLLQLATGSQGHRVTAVMIYEWATGISVKELAEREGVSGETRGGAQSGSANPHLRHINKILKDYFGTPYKTTIGGRQVGRAYTVRRYFRLRDQEPYTLTLQVEWAEGTLDVRP